MATIRPKDLPAAASVANTVALIVDTGSTVEKATPGQVVDAAIPLASQAEAEAGVDNAKRVTPLRVKQAIDALGPTASTLEFSQSGIGAFIRSVLTKLLEQKVSIDDYGDANTGNGIGDDTAALLKATTALSSTGGVVKFTRGKNYIIGDHEMVRGVTYEGEGRSFIDLFATRPVAKITCKAGATGIFRNAATRIDSLGFKHLFLYSPAGRGHIFDWSLGGTVAKVDMKGITAIQLDPAKRIINGDASGGGASGGIFSIWCSDFDFQYATGATVSPVFIKGFTVNSITFRQGWITLTAATSPSTVKQVHIESTNPGGQGFNVKIEDIEHEVPLGGCVGLYSIGNSSIRNSMVYDLEVPPQAPMYEVRKGASGPPSSSITFENVRSTFGTVTHPDLVLDCSVVGQGNFAVNECVLAVAHGVSTANGPSITVRNSSITTKQNMAWLEIGGGPGNDIHFGTTDGSARSTTLSNGYASNAQGYFVFKRNGAYAGAITPNDGFQWGGSLVAPNVTLTAAGEGYYNGDIYRNNQKVIGARGAALPADATDLATALTLVNAIKARLKVTGGHGLVAD